MNKHFEKIERDISRATSEQERDELKSALFNLKAFFARDAFEAEIAEARNKALRQKLLPVKFFCVVLVLYTIWWNASLFLDGGHYTMHHKFITFADQPILYIINAIAWVALVTLTTVFLYWLVKLIFTERQNSP